MTKWHTTKISKFLKEREGRYDPADKAVQYLKRLNKIDFSGEIHLSDKNSKTDMIIVEPGDLVISGINVSKGALAVYHGDEPITATIHYSSYIFDESQIDIEYFKRFVKSQSFVQTLKEQVKGGIKTEIKSKHFLPLEIKLPNIDEQKEIISFFKKVENEMAELGGEIDLQQGYLKKLLQQILQEAIEGKLTADWRKKNSKLISGENHASKLLEKIKAEKERLIKEGKIKKEKPLAPNPGDEKPYDLPEGWVWCRLGEISAKITDGTHHSPINLASGKYKYITAKNIKNEGIDLTEITYVSSDVHKEIYMRCNPVKGDILYIKDGATTGIVTINNLDEEFSMLSSVALIKPMINRTYLMYAMRSPLFYKNTRADMYGVAITRVTLEKIVNSILPIPPLSEQDAIVERLDKFMTMVDELEKQVTERKNYSERLMQSVLREAFS